MADAKLPSEIPWMPSPYDEADRASVRAVAEGNASETQQRRAMVWIVNTCAGLYDRSFRTGVDGDRQTAFAEGKRYVGSEIVKLTKIPPETAADRAAKAKRTTRR